MCKDDEGKVHVTEHEKPTQHGAWTGAAVRALIGGLLPAGDAQRSGRRCSCRWRDGHAAAACRQATRRSSVSSSATARPR